MSAPRKASRHAEAMRSKNWLIEAADDADSAIVHMPICGKLPEIRVYSLPKMGSKGPSGNVTFLTRLDKRGRKWKDGESWL